MSNPNVAGLPEREGVGAAAGIRRTPLVCPLLSIGRMIAESHKLVAVPGGKPGEITFPSCACLKDQCAWFVPLNFDKDGTVLYGSCAVQLGPPALSSIQGILELAAGLAKAPTLKTTEN